MEKDEELKGDWLSNWDIEFIFDVQWKEIILLSRVLLSSLISFHALFGCLENVKDKFWGMESCGFRYFYAFPDSMMIISCFSLFFLLF